MNLMNIVIGIIVVAVLGVISFALIGKDVVTQDDVVLDLDIAGEEMGLAEKSKTKQESNKSQLATPDKVVWIDVRTPEEFNEDHMKDVPNIPHGQIVDGVAKLTDDKNTVIYLYCRSGTRAGIAEDALLAEGYTRVINAGSLAQARALRAQQNGY
ncbi:MAG: rhodanese-like domain-containing protein [Oleibacter sp.]|nr:rhodanese-like domain-containing protein [Thalassolituus sp.]